MPFREESCRSSCIYSGPLHSYSCDAASQHPSTRAGAESIQLIYSGRALQALSDLARQFRCPPIFWREFHAYVYTSFIRVTLLIDVCDMAHSCVTCLIHKCYILHSGPHSFICVTRRRNVLVRDLWVRILHVCDMRVPHSCTLRLIHALHNSSI